MFFFILRNNYVFFCFILVLRNSQIRLHLILQSYKDNETRRLKFKSALLISNKIIALPRKKNHDFCLFFQKSRIFAPK